MEIQNWIMAQMVIDLVIACVLLWFIRTNIRSKKEDPRVEEAFQRSEGILEEIRELSLSLERNLEEKRKISSTIMEQLDEALERAEDTYRRIRDTARDLGANPERSKNISKNSDQMRASVDALMQKGLSREDIAHHLGMSVDEIDLLIKIRNRSNR